MIDANGNKHAWTAGEYLSTTHMGKKEAMNLALMRGLGIETTKADLATATNITTPDQLAASGEKLVQSQNAQNRVRLLRRVRSMPGLCRVRRIGLGDPQSATAAATTQANALHNEVNGGLLKVQEAPIGIKFANSNPSLMLQERVTPGARSRRLRMVSRPTRSRPH